jgi:hypothetical protein
MAALTAVLSFYPLCWGFGYLVLAAGLPFRMSFLLSTPAAVAVGWYIWGRTRSQTGFARSVSIGALATVGISFLAGFVGPMVLAPDANQGPLLGIFLTGPLGFVFGAAGGAIYWFARGRRRELPGDHAA